MAKPNRKKNRMYLVVLRTNLDELPILLTADRKMAVQKAKNTTDEEANEAADIMGVDCAGRIVMAIITFVDGIPKRLDLIKDWEEDEKEAA